MKTSQTTGFIKNAIKFYDFTVYTYYLTSVFVYFIREPIGLAVLQLLENGQLQKFHKKWWYDKGECIPEDTKVGFLN